MCKTEPDRQWPFEDQEVVSRCPVCGSASRAVAFADLRDRIFFCAPGTWTMMRCNACRSCYLDPRPNRETIGRAYDQYYTHDAVVTAEAAQLSAFRQLRRLLANGYRNWRFSGRLVPSSPFGRLAAIVLPSFRRMIDRQYRHLPRTRKGRVLDIGFGNAKFLEDAQAIGWQAVGTDIDPKVIAAARSKGLDVVFGTADEIDGVFDQITLSHSIEHCHDPCSVIVRCYQLLAPGGAIWIETPNADALGLRRYGADWRGLEPPRHLVLFTRDSLVAAMHRAGFRDVHDYAQPSGIVKALYAMSDNIRRRRDPAGSVNSTPLFRLAVAIDTLRERFDPRCREFIGVIARKSDDEVPSAAALAVRPRANI